MWPCLRVFLLFRGGTFFQTVSTPVGIELVNGFHTEFGAHRSVMPDLANAYASVVAFAKAVSSAGSFLPRDITKAIYNMPFQGPSGTVYIDGSNHMVDFFRVGKYNKSSGWLQVIHETHTGLCAAGGFQSVLYIYLSLHAFHLAYTQSGRIFSRAPLSLFYATIKCSRHSLSQ